MSSTMQALDILTRLFLLSLVVLAVLVVVLYVIDVRQTKSTVRRNFPVIGRFRFLFEHLGEFFRQYFFAMDREEMPFNRAQRSWVYRAAKAVDNTVAFGSTRDLRPPGTLLFVNCAYPTLERDAEEIPEVEIGPGCVRPYRTSSLFNISAMSFGAISEPAITALSNGARMAGIWMNTGEGGLAPYHLAGGADIVFQIGTAKYGVRDAQGLMSNEKLREVAAHDQVKMFEIKLSQGAKPGKGGILPGAKVTEEIARIRLIEPGVDSISPNRHPEVENEKDLLELIDRVRSVTGKPTGIKCVIGEYEWLECLCEEILARGIDSAPDFMTIDSADGGTGAAPMSLIDYMGLPIRESLPVVVDILTRYGLKGRVKVIASGKLINPSEVAFAICVGADFVQSARGFMFALGCIQALQCNNNTCPTGVTTHDPKLHRGLDPTDKAERVKNYALGMHKELCLIAHSCGVAEPRELSRAHCRIVQGNGRSIAVDDLYPTVSNLRINAP